MGAADGVADEVEGDDPTTVLVVDDESLVRDSFELYLEDPAYEVYTASTGTRALEVVDEDVDVVLLDRRLPDRSGEDVLREIRNRNLDCRVALVTAVEPAFDIVEMDCDDYLVKPVAADDLVSTVERLELLDEYDDARRELGALRVKKNVLEVEKSEAELADSEEFSRLVSRMSDLEAAIDDLEDEVDGLAGDEK